MNKKRLENLENQKIELLKLQVKVRDKIIGNLLKEIANNDVKIPDTLLTAIKVLYDKGNKNERQYKDSETKKTE